MPDIKLPRLPDRTPIRLVINITPRLADDLAAYAVLYQNVYGREEPIPDLIPAILAAYLESDRAFVRAKV